LISGIAAYVKRLKPSIRVIGVEPTDADAMARSLRAASAWCSITSGFSPTESRSPRWVRTFPACAPVRR
jgi:cysteine synthase